MSRNKIHKQWLNGSSRYLHGWGFICMILLMVVLLSMKNSFMVTNPEQTLFYEVFEGNNETWHNAGLIGTAVFQFTDVGNTSEWLIIFFPFIAAYTFVTIFCDDFQSGFVRSAAVRMGTQRYLRRMFRYGILNILITGLVALILFGIFCAITCIPLHDLPQEESTMLYKAIWRKTYTGAGSPSLWSFLYPILHNSMVILFVMLLEGLVSFLIAAATKNKYFSLCGPCMVLYILIKTSDSLTEHGYGWAQYLSPAIWFVHIPAVIVIISLSLFIITATEEVFIRLLEKEVDCLAY